ncbi:PKD domain-containing protein [Cellvibrio japonicus]|uniref:Carbohydrate binding protein, cbp2A n=1 Tax=Cellvibrio japonicus (strain Ueda107) TaxID=498211 RepID=B3PEM8_CELJU|nr:PKD domain-containing protein [Cellvibrio japonicus]ACE83535.1 carbohydrate binding protein, cbp2A [Cellvibrio japonicus Ueda107]QEI10769.1 PKD domain-containing protein [Cellvibrio japonicus]QEI14345.1 PKD domain-containing protein [Cellvibrio japonicus]QEI17923.1 PKD domain-containing protein [Cellvibrio japonicus]
MSLHRPCLGSLSLSGLSLALCLGIASASYASSSAVSTSAQNSSVAVSSSPASQSASSNPNGSSSRPGSSSGYCGYSSVSSSGQTSSAQAYALTCTLNVTNSWNSAYQASVIVKNNSATPVEGWKLAVENPGISLGSAWNVQHLETTANSVTFGNLGWNGLVAPGGTVEFGAIFNHSGSGQPQPVCRIIPPGVVSSSPAANQPPVADFATTVKGASVHVLTINAHDPDGDNLRYLVDFGDGTRIAYPDAWHTYKTPGTYTITQTVGDGQLSHVQTREVTVGEPGANRAPVAIFSHYGYGSQVSVNGGGSADIDGDSLTYTWDFGSGPLVGNQRSSGTVVNGLVTLTVFDGELGDTRQETAGTLPCTYYDPRPLPDFTYRIEGATVYLDASNSRIVDSFRWDFGDGTVGTGTYTSHTYAEPGAYTIELYANGGMMSNRVSQVIQIEAGDNGGENLPPVAALSCTEQLVIGDDFENGIAYYTYTTRCSAAGSSDPENSPLSYRIDWGDGSSSPVSTNTNFAHNYTESGYYTITLHVSDGVNTSSKTLDWQASRSYSTGPQPEPGPTRCEFKITSSWNSGFTGWLRVYNDSNAPVSGWEAEITLAANQQISSSWNGTLSGASPVKVSSVAWNATINPGSFAEVGFQILSSNNPHPVPHLGGQSCL